MSITLAKNIYNMAIFTPDTKNEFSLDEDIMVNVKFSIMGGLRDSFTEKNRASFNFKQN